MLAEKWRSNLSLCRLAALSRKKGNVRRRVAPAFSCVQVRWRSVMDNGELMEQRRCEDGPFLS